MTQMTFLKWAFGLNVVLVLGVIACIVIFIVFAIKHKKKTPVLIAGIALIMLNTTLNYYTVSHATFYKYNDSTIVGSTTDKIEKKYGPFEDRGEIEGKLYVRYAIKSEDEQPLYYWMLYDETGNVYEVYSAPSERE